MKKIILMSVCMVLFCFFSASAIGVDVTVKQQAFNLFLVDFNPFSALPVWEVGVEVMPKLDLVGQFWFYTHDNNCDDNNDARWVMFPGVGARYTFWENENLGTYAYGNYSSLVQKRGSDGDKVNCIAFGLGATCKLNDNYALIGETGVQRNRTEDIDSIEESYTSVSTMGLRVSF